MGRKAIETVSVGEQKSAAKGKQEIKALPAVFANEEMFRAYIALATLLSSDKAADAENENLTVNKLLTVKQSIANYKANGIALEEQFYPKAVCVGGLYCGINRPQRGICAVGFIGERKLAFTISTRATKPLPELKGEKYDYGYSSKCLTRLASNSGTLSPCAIDFNRLVEFNFGLPYYYSLSKADLLDYAQWLNNPKAFAEYKEAAAEFEEVNYDDANYIDAFCTVAKNNGFEIYRQDVMKVAIDYQRYLQSVISGDNFTAVQKDKAQEMLNGGAKVNVAKQA